MQFKKKIIIVLMTVFSFLLFSGFSYEESESEVLFHFEEMQLQEPLYLNEKDFSYEEKEPIIYSYEELKYLDLTTESNLTAEQLESGLKGELKKYSEDYIKAEQHYGINAVFLAAKDALESGWGKYSYNYNLSGWGSADYASHEECIDNVSRDFKDWYLTPPHDCNRSDCKIGKYYSGTTVFDVNNYYNSNEEWGYQVLSIMAEIYSDIDLN